jgi:hypothetical protein
VVSEDSHREFDRIRLHDDKWVSRTLRQCACIVFEDVRIASCQPFAVDAGPGVGRDCFPGEHDHDVGIDLFRVETEVDGGRPVIEGIAKVCPNAPQRVLAGSTSMADELQTVNTRDDLALEQLHGKLPGTAPGGTNDRDVHGLIIVPGPRDPVCWSRSRGAESVTVRTGFAGRVPLTPCLTSGVYERMTQ